MSLSGRLDAGVHPLDLRVVPLRDFTQVHFADRFGIEFQFSRLHAGNIDHQHDAAHHGRELEQVVFREKFRRLGRVGCAEVNRPLRDLLDPAAGTDGLVVQLYARYLVVFICPCGIHGIGERCARAVQHLLCLRLIEWPASRLIVMRLSKFVSCIFSFLFVVNILYHRIVTGLLQVDEVSVKCFFYYYIYYNLLFYRLVDQS